MAEVAVTLYAGPSAHGLPAGCLHGIDLLPPARRGDIGRLVDSGAEPGVIVLCDGIFQFDPAVSHAELCAALDAGWQLWGTSSLGAIRAYEMRDHGMQGHGWVHAQFARHDDFADDELCLLHLPLAPYAALTEPLVNLRYAFEMQGAAFGIGTAEQQAVIDGARALWFGDRTLAALRALLVAAGGTSEAAAERLLGWMEHNRIKTIDLLTLLRGRPWQPAP